MQYETLSDGTELPVLGLGTWHMGGAATADYSQDKEMVAIMEYAIELGYTHIDTAEYYGNGHTEELLGKALAGRDRESLFITSKVWPNHLRYGEVHSALDRTLERLGTDYVDLYLIHHPSDTVPLEETMQALNEAVRDGRTKRIGVSNFELSRLRRAMELAETPLATNQVRYNLLDRTPDRNGVLDYCQDHNVIVTAYSPVKGGVLRNTAVQEIAERHGCTPAQVALKWLVDQPQVVTIPMSSDRTHLRQNLEALSVELSQEEVDRLDRIES